MLTFFVTVAVNILICTVFYLIISLKLEKSASDFRIKKLHKEMDSIIREFNESADRNISLLENKIRVLKKLLEKNNLDANIDIKVNSSVEEMNALGLSENKNSTIEKIKNQKNIIPNSEKEIEKKSKSTVDYKVDDVINIDYGGSLVSSIEEDAEDLEKMFTDVTDKHSLVGELYQKGHSPETISRYSGIPEGEIKLILNLNGYL